MSKPHPDANDLVMTQAELPPGIDAPSPQAVRDRVAAESALPDDIERDILRLADRVGGLRQLRELVSVLEGRRR
jgi:hypothetical protein